MTNEQKQKLADVELSTALTTMFITNVDGAKSREELRELKAAVDSLAFFDRITADDYAAFNQALDLHPLYADEIDPNPEIQGKDLV